MPGSVHRIGNMTIQHVDGGYVLIITGKTGSTTVLLIRNDGGMIDTSGAAIDSGDRAAARTCLPLAGAEDLIPLLHQARLTPEAARAIRQRMIPRG